MFADDVVLCAREKDQLELELEQWMEALEKRGMKVSRATQRQSSLHDIAPKWNALPNCHRSPTMTDSGDGTNRETKARKTEAEMDGLCQPRHKSHRNDERRGPWQNWLEEDCVCRSDPTTKWERLEEEEDCSASVPTGCMMFLVLINLWRQVFMYSDSDSDSDLFYFVSIQHSVTVMYIKIMK